MEDVRALAAEQPGELDESRDIAPEAQRPPEIAKGEEADAGLRGGLVQRAWPVGGDRDVEAAKARKQRGNVGLGPAGLGEGDEQQQARAAGAGG